MKAIRTVAQSKSVEGGRNCYVVQYVVRHVDRALQCAAYLSKFGLRKVLDHGVQKDYEMFGHPKSSGGRNEEGIVGYEHSVRAGVAEGGADGVGWGGNTMGDRGKIPGPGYL